MARSLDTAQVTVMEKVRSANAPRVSVARTTNENVPRVVGVPVIRAAEIKFGTTSTTMARAAAALPRPLGKVLAGPGPGGGRSLLNHQLPLSAGRQAALRASCWRRAP